MSDPIRRALRTLFNPALTSNNAANMRLGYPMVCCENSGPFAALATEANRAYLFPSKNCMRAIAACKVAISALRNLVPRVLQVRPWMQMPVSDTGGIVACMHHGNSRGDGSVLQFPGKSVSPYIPATCREHPIVSGIPFRLLGALSHPQPTISDFWAVQGNRSVSINPGPESFGRRLRRAPALNRAEEVTCSIRAMSRYTKEAPATSTDHLGVSAAGRPGATHGTKPGLFVWLNHKKLSAAFTCSFAGLPLGNSEALRRAIKPKSMLDLAVAGNEQSRAHRARTLLRIPVCSYMAGVGAEASITPLDLRYSRLKSARAGFAGAFNGTFVWHRKLIPSGVMPPAVSAARGYLHFTRFDLVGVA